jgi:hypothetical protein
VAHMWYTGNDKQNSWASTVHNVLQNYRGAETFQRPGAWNFAGAVGDATAKASQPSPPPPPLAPAAAAAPVLRRAIQLSQQLLGFCPTCPPPPPPPTCIELN